MDRSARRFVATTFVVYIVAVGVFLLYSQQQYEPQQVLSVFYGQWVLSNALYLFIDHLIPVQLVAVVLTFSLLLGSSRGRAAVPFFELVRPVLVVVILLSFLYTVAVAFAEPALARSRNEAEHRSALADTFRSGGDQAFGEGNWARAVADYEAYLSINPEAAAVEQNLADARQRLNEARREPPAEASQPPAGHEVTDQSVAQLLERARTATEDNDWISAHYWARLALDLESGNEQAQRIVREAKRRMASLELSDLDENERARYVRKREAYQAWVDGDIFRAHRIFSDLSRQYPNDGDVERYLPQVEEALREVAFFVDEYRRNIQRPGSSNIVYVDGPAEGTGRRSFTAIGRLVTTGEGTYASDFELFEIATNGEVVRHLSAPAAKLREGRFVLQGVERGTENLVYRADYRTVPADTGTPPYAQVRFTPSELHALRDTGPRFTSVGVADLMMMEEFLPRLGYSADGVRLALAMRLVSPFSFVILSFFAVAAAWAWRSRYIRRPPVLALIVIPVVPFVLAILTTVYHYLHRVIIGALLSAADFTPAIIAAVLIQALLLLISLAVLAGQSTS